MEKTIFDCILLLVLGFFILIKGSDIFVDGASSIAKKLKISRSYVSRIEKKAIEKLMEESN